MQVTGSISLPHRLPVPTETQCDGRPARREVVARRTPPRDRPHATPTDGHQDNEVIDLFRRYRATEDRALRNELVERHRYLANVTAQRFAGRGEPLPDLVQVALLALVKAVERFDPDYGVGFPAFAMPTLLGELRRHFRDYTWPVHVSRRGQELHLAMGAALESLHHELGRSPTPAELAVAMGVSTDEVLHAAEAGNAYRTASVEAHHALEEGQIQTSDLRLTLESALQSLPEREQRLIHLRFVEERSQAEIGRIVGLSQVHVSRLLRSSLESLRSRLSQAAEPA